MATEILIFYTARDGSGYFLEGYGDDFGASGSIDRARTFANKKTAMGVVQSCAARWRVPVERFTLLKRA
ncbi:hypothetical protein [Burkholderia ubonensis]|uniref:hypothetical protein n=1 Tax=Burkholderia ubonensis TaxID=101571 RepID=UPI000ACCA530|nr:hypothetical protein [Burkholderia ubonensis]